MAFGTVNTKTGSNEKLQDGVNAIDKDIKEIKLLKEYTHTQSEGNIYEVIKFKTKNEFYYRDTAGYLRTYDITNNTYSDKKGTIPAGKTILFGSYVIKGSNVYNSDMTLVASLPGTIFFNYEKNKMFCYTFNYANTDDRVITIWSVNTSNFAATQLFTETYVNYKQSNGGKETIYLAYIFAQGNHVYFGVTKGQAGYTTFKYLHKALNINTKEVSNSGLKIEDPYKTYDTIGVLYNGKNIILYHGIYTDNYSGYPEITYYKISCNNEKLTATTISELTYTHKTCTNTLPAVDSNFLMLGSDKKSLSYLFTYGDSIEIRQVSNGNNFTGYKGKGADYMIFAEGAKVSVFKY